MNFQIRETIEEDLEQVAQLYQSAFGEETNLPKMYEKFEKLKDNKHYLNYSAVTPENELVGFMRVVIHEDMFGECKDLATIWSVRAKYKRQKIATKMFAFVEQELRQKNVEFMALIAVNTDEANGFYQSLEYEKSNAYFKKL